MKERNVLFTSIDGFIGLNIFKKFSKSNFYFLTDKISRVNHEKSVYHYNDFEKILKSKKINIVFNNRGILLGRPRDLNKVNYLDSKRIFNLTSKYMVDYFINLDTNKALNSPDLPSSIIGHGKGSEYHNSKENFRQFFMTKKSSFNKINIHCDIIYGPNDKLHKFVNKTVFEIMNNDKNITLYNPNLVRNFLYIDDFLKYINKLIVSIHRLDKPYSELFFSSAEFNTLHEFISTIKYLLKSNIFINSHKGNLYKKTNQILKNEFDSKKNPNWLRLKATVDLKVGLGRVIKPLLKGEI